MELNRIGQQQKLGLFPIVETESDGLLKLLSGEGHNGLIRDATMHLISNEILIRQIKESSKPHLTVYLGLLLAFIAAVTGVIAIIK
ncbi:MAG: hypothetical protein L0G09_16975 [Acinetobacter sp.]|nr:hypothetical protein [Acinetobacter sp.]MDN5489686.1 hypothetical protein [Acinetobacter sp.]MDN5650276.1 hypothetical protein [Acinetobacter sp.]MDN5690200.1 hypothetical protein [Acinetobacter sp.]